MKVSKYDRIQHNSEHTVVFFDKRTGARMPFAGQNNFFALNSNNDYACYSFKCQNDMWISDKEFF